jgi:hypothetical protein
LFTLGLEFSFDRDNCHDRHRFFVGYFAGLVLYG